MFWWVSSNRILWHHWHYLDVPCLRMWHFNPLMFLQSRKNKSVCLMNTLRGMCQHLFCFGAMFKAIMKCKVVGLFTFLLYILWMRTAIKNEKFFYFHRDRKFKNFFSHLSICHLNFIQHTLLLFNYKYSVKLQCWISFSACKWIILFQTFLYHHKKITRFSVNYIN